MIRRRILSSFYLCGMIFIASSLSFCANSPLDQLLVTDSLISHNIDNTSFDNTSADNKLHSIQEADHSNTKKQGFFKRIKQKIAPYRRHIWYGIGLTTLATFVAIASKIALYKTIDQPENSSSLFKEKPTRFFSQEPQLPTDNELYIDTILTDPSETSEAYRSFKKIHHHFKETLEDHAFEAPGLRHCLPPDKNLRDLTYELIKHPTEKNYVSTCNYFINEYVSYKNMQQFWENFKNNPEVQGRCVYGFINFSLATAAVSVLLGGPLNSSVVHILGKTLPFQQATINTMFPHFAKWIAAIIK